MLTPDTSELLTPGAVAELLAVSKPTVYRLVESGDLPAVRIGGQLRIDANELGEWIEHNRVEANA
jgi:excisionase family DNA binding protein